MQIWSSRDSIFNPILRNGLSHTYQMDESTFTYICMGSGSDFYIFVSFCDEYHNYMSANRIAPDGTPRFAASRLGLFCLIMPHIKDLRLIRVNNLS